MLKLCNSIKTNVWYFRSLEKLAIKMWFFFNFENNLKNLHFVVSGSKNLKLSTNTCLSANFQKNLLPSFLLFSSVCYQDDLSNSERNEIASSTARNFNNIWLICQIFRSNKPLPKYLTDEKFKKWAVFIFEIKGAKKDKIFSFLKGRFSVMGVPMDVIFSVFSEAYVRLLKSITSQFLSRYSKSYNNLTIKSCLKRTDRVGATKLYVPNTTL